MALSSGQRDKVYGIMFPQARRKKTYEMILRSLSTRRFKWDEESRSGNNPAANDNADRFNDDVIVMWKPRLKREVNGSGHTKNVVDVWRVHFRIVIIKKIINLI